MFKIAWRWLFDDAFAIQSLPGMGRYLRGIGVGVGQLIATTGGDVASLTPWHLLGAALSGLLIVPGSASWERLGNQVATRRNGGSAG